MYLHNEVENEFRLYVGREIGSLIIEFNHYFLRTHVEESVKMFKYNSNV